ncbi:MAG TPA: 5-oxoprolinase subunit PxpB [Flavisolibacter sp.]|jgi:inhibitor of KinA|nr:5-oxoprolinase subunit PxpB [Flavisolibacter sp.]
MSIYHPYTIFPLGDSALIIDFGNQIDEHINRKVFNLYFHLKSRTLSYITDLVPAYSSLAVYYNVVSVHYINHEKTAFETMAEMIENITAFETEINIIQPKNIRVPVCYESKFAPDLQEVASAKKLSGAEVIHLHTSKKYRVYMLGFLPGFPYLGEVDEKLAMPRKSEPRLKVNTGSVGIAGKQTGIYPIESPGGWQIIGCTPLSIFNKEDINNPVLFSAGDEVTFYSISEDEFDHYKAGHTR